ncbi:MAG: NAD(+)/NADH kinase [Sphaerochaetaceae bacterium]|nr:NAD(+)/NADH kinase [Sphaerochaetaceae bacterium]
MVENVLIIANWKKEESHALSMEIEQYLSQKGIHSITIRTSDEQKELVVPSNADLAISLGGDGTVLYCSHYLHDFGIPILAINLGTFGYITEISKDEWKEELGLYLQGDGRLSRRLMIRVTVVRDGHRLFSSHGLNEMVVSSSGISKVVNLSMKMNDTLAGIFRADGLIIATPTGSTGYSLAAGGPILDVDLDDLIVTPVCPFTLSNRPLVVNGETQISITVLPGQRTDLMLTVDGQQTFCLLEGDTVVVEKARSKALIVTSCKRSYIEVIRDKLNWAKGGFHA